MLRFTSALALSLMLALPAAGEALAKNDKAKGNGKPAHVGGSSSGGGSSGGSSSVDSAVGAAVGAATAVLASELLSSEDRRIIERHYQTHSVSYQALPPGIAKKQVPGDLRSQVRIPSGYELEQVGADVLLIEVGTRVIAEVLKDIVRN